LTWQHGPCLKSKRSRRFALWRIISFGLPAQPMPSTSSVPRSFVRRLWLLISLYLFDSSFQFDFTNSISAVVAWRHSGGFSVPYPWGPSGNRGCGWLLAGDFCVVILTYVSLLTRVSVDLKELKETGFQLSYFCYSG
jgi:hypothetical protein